MKVLIADKFQESGVTALTEAGCEVIHDPSLDGDKLRTTIAETGCAVLVVRSTKVTADMLTAGNQLNVVVRAGAGYNTIDVGAASTAGVLVANCPGKNAVAVAELTFGLMLALDRRIVDNTVDLRAGVWNKKLYSEARGLKGRTLGVIGLGQIGKAVVKRAKAFGMPVLAWSRSLTEDDAQSLGVTRCESVLDVSARCDVLTLHIAASPETKGLIGAEVIDALAPGSYLINTSRADVVDYDALAKAVASRGLRVGLDVYPNEPASGDGAFVGPMVSGGGIVYGTHHIGASTEQAQEAIAEETVRIVLAYQQSGHVENCVNLCRKSAAKFVAVVRHRNRPGVLAHALSVIRHAGVNVEEMNNVIFEGDQAACAQIKLTASLDQRVLSEIESGNENVLGVSLFEVSE